VRHAIWSALVLGVSIAAAPAFASTPDGLLTSKTKLALWTTAGVRSTTVHVDSDDGIVTLYGKVPSADQRETAERTARGVAGVIGVRNLLQIVAEADEKRIDRSDGEVSALAEKALKADPILENSKISVKSVDKGVVLLTGEARSVSDHLRAVMCVDRIPGVRRVTSEVKGPEGFSDEERIAFLNRAHPKFEGKRAEVRSSANDMRITATVKYRLLTASQVPSHEISVDTSDAVVTLFGMVPTVQIRREAGHEAGKVGGVLRVNNQLEVVPSSQKQRAEAKDDDIGRDLKLAFKDRSEFKDVDTAVKNGTVRLTGTVDSEWDELKAVRLARKVSGVRHVDDRLKVEDQGPSKTTRRD
jgi:osmotically-inducible protein OsmY